MSASATPVIPVGVITVNGDGFLQFGAHSSPYELNREKPTFSFKHGCMYTISHCQCFPSPSPESRPLKETKLHKCEVAVFKLREHVFEAPRLSKDRDERKAHKVAIRRSSSKFSSASSAADKFVFANQQHDRMRLIFGSAVHRFPADRYAFILEASNDGQKKSYCIPEGDTFLHVEGEDLPLLKAESLINPNPTPADALVPLFQKVVSPASTPAPAALAAAPSATASPLPSRFDQQTAVPQRRYSGQTPQPALPGVVTASSPPPAARPLSPVPAALASPSAVTVSLASQLPTQAPSKVPTPTEASAQAEGGCSCVVL